MRKLRQRAMITAAAAAAVATAAAVTPLAASGGAGHGGLSAVTTSLAGTPTTTPIKHLVVIFDENVSFDHYFGTYPNALNPKGEPAFHAAPGTPTVNGLDYALLHDTTTRTCRTRSGSALPRHSPATRTTATPPGRTPSTTA